VRHIADRIAVMYLGHIVEIGPADALFAAPRHPYTLALLSAAPIPDPVRERTRQRIVLTGEQPSVLQLPRGCVFADRCQLRPTLEDRIQRRCRDERPALTEAPDGTTAACHAT
jgi:peptide/nickel transport system ATP-binding protein